MNMQGSRFCLAGITNPEVLVREQMSCSELFPFHRLKIQIFPHKITPRALFLKSQSRGKGEDHSRRDGYKLRCCKCEHKPFKCRGFVQPAWEGSDLCFIPNAASESWDSMNTWTPPAWILLHPPQLVPLFQESYSAVPGENKRCCFSMIKGTKLKQQQHRDTALFFLITSALESIEWSSQGSGEAAAAGFDKTW